MRRVAFLLSSVVAFAGGPALAGVVVTLTETELSDNKPQTVTVSIDNDRMKVVNGRDTMIYRGDLQKMWVIKDAEKTYTEITPQAMQQMGGQMADAMAQMQAQMAQLPPAQRAQIEAMMGARGGAALGAGGPARQAQVSYAKAGPGKTVASWHCDDYAKTVDGQKQEDLCIAPIGSVGLNAGDFKVLESMTQMMGPFAQQAAQRSDYMGLDAMNKAIGFQGVPLETVSYAGGKAERRTSVNKIDRTGIPAGAFELPAGLRKEDMGPPGRPR